MFRKRKAEVEVEVEERTEVKARGGCSVDHSEKVVADLDFSTVPDFHKKVYLACMQIPPGRVSTYKDLAAQIDAPKACRAVGTALRRNPFAPTVPCHRVVASNLTLGGFYGSTDINGDLLKKKRRMLEEEGVKFVGATVSKASVHSF